MPREEIGIEITARDRASDTLEDVADLSEDLEQAEPTVTVDADTRDAERKLEQADDAARELTDRDRELVLTARVGDLRAQLAQAEGDLERFRGTADRAAGSVREVGGPTSVSGVTDVAGLFGDAEGAASTFGGSVEGVMDLLEQLGPAVGLSADNIGRLAAGLGFVGIGVAAGAAVVQIFKSRSEALKAEIREQTTAFRDAIDDGLNPYAERARRLIIENEGLSENMATVGLSGRDLAAALRGELTPAVRDALELADAYGRTQSEMVSGSAEQVRAIDELAAAHGLTRDELEAAADAASHFRAAVEDETGVLGEAAAATERQDRQLQSLNETTEAGVEAANEWLDAQLAAADASFAARDAAADFAAAISATNEARAAGDPEAYADAVRSERDAALEAADAAARLADEQARQAGTTLTAEGRLDALNASLLESARQATPDARAEIALYIAEVNGIPLERATEILANADTGAAAAELDRLANPPGGRTANVAVRFNVQETGTYVGGTFIPGYFPGRQSAPVTNVTVHAPRGMSARDYVTAADRYARRNGRLLR